VRKQPADAIGIPRDQGSTQRIKEGEHGASGAL
jgi:hypothetical protein